MNHDELPKFHETFNPILDILSDGKIILHRELIKRVFDKYYSALSKELLDQQTKSGEPLISNRIAWGKSYLKKGGYISYPERGKVQITKKGKEANNKRLDLTDIIGETGLIDFFSDEKGKSIAATSDLQNSSPQDLIDKGFSEIEAQLKNELLLKLKSIDAFYFEKVVLILLKKMGYGDYIETPRTGDGGIDGILNEDKLGLDRIYIQAKKYTENKVRETDIRDFIGAMSGDTSKGVFVTTTGYDNRAIQKAHDASHKIVLIDGKKLVDLMLQFNVGVQNKFTYEVKELDDDFFEGE